MIDSRFTRASVPVRRRHVVAVAAGSALALLAFTGCAAAATGTSTGAAPASPNATASASASASASATPTPTPEPTGTPIALTCEQLLTPPEIYDFNPNFGTAPAYEPADDSLAATALKYSGLACAWSNQTSGELIEIAVTQPEAALMMTLKDRAISDSKVVPTYSSSPEIEGFFAVKRGSGEVQVFTGAYWLTLTSPAFFEPGDAQTLVAAVLAHLG